MLFSTLLLAHLLADYPFQPDWLVARKQRWPWLMLHGTIVSAMLLALLLPMLPYVWSLLLLIGGAHTLQDWLKLRLGPRLPGAPLLPYLLDQGAHMLLLAACAWLPTLRGIQPPLPQAIYICCALLVLLCWTLPITVRVARAAPALHPEQL